MESPSHNQTSDTQQIVLNIVPFPSAILSILGSTGIIYLAKQRRKVQQWTPYTRLLVAMSTCDILFSIMISTVPFFRPKHSDMVGALGNDETCNFAAFMNQATTAGIWYQGMLSIYFWLTARCGMKNDRIAKKIEPFMHLLALGYPIGTAIVGAVMGVYGERYGATSCWIDKYRVHRAADGTITRVKDTQNDALVYIFYVVPVVFVGLCLIYTQSSIYFFVRSHIRKSSPQDGSDEHTSCNGDVEVSLDSSGHSITAMGSTESDHQAKSTGISKTSKTSSSYERNKDTQRRRRTTLRRQSQRLQLVCSQAFLFVMAFGLCHVVNLIMAALQSGAKTKVEEMEMLAKNHHIAVMQRILFPIQGLFNFLIYVRPKYMMLRRKFPIEGRLMTMRRIFQGHRQLVPRFATNHKPNVNLEITHGAANDRDAPAGDAKTLKSYPTPDRMARNMMSSITVSDGDFDSIADELLGDGERWSDVSSHLSQGTPSDLASGVNRLTTLEAISELSQSVFELTPYQVNGSHLSVVSDRVSIPSEPSESRWKGAETPSVTSKTSEGSSSTQDTEKDLAGPQRSRSLGMDSKPKVPMRNPVSPDCPIRVPMGTVDTSSASDVPIRAPIRRTSDTSIDYAPMSRRLISCTVKASSDPSLETKSQRSACLKIGQSAKRVQTSDMPLTLPERFQSQSPSEIEDV